LKKRFAIGESTDDELSAQVDDYARLLGTITLDQWRDVLRVEGRTIVLQLAIHGWSYVVAYLESVRALEVQRVNRPKGRVLDVLPEGTGP
jgi:hypothetical protein